MSDTDSRQQKMAEAAALDLLAALRAMIDEWDRHGCCDSRGVVYAARRAVEKAGSPLRGATDGARQGAEERTLVRPAGAKCLASGAKYRRPV
jgi:hypothetical protein